MEVNSSGVSSTYIFPPENIIMVNVSGHRFYVDIHVDINGSMWTYIIYSIPPHFLCGHKWIHVDIDNLPHPTPISYVDINGIILQAPA